MADAAISIKFGAETSDAVAGIKKVEFTLKDCYGALKELKAARLTITDDGQLASANRKITDLTQSIKNLERAGTSGFDELGNAISKTSNPLEKAYGGIRKLAYIIPGIGIGGLFALAFEGIAAAVSSFVGSADKAAAAQLKLNEALGAGDASVQGEVARLTSLSSIALDTANSTKVRKEAFEKLQELYPGYLGNLKFEKISYDDLKTALDKVSSALVRQAQIKGLEGAIEETYKNLNKTVAEGGTTFEKVTGNVSGFVAALEKSFNLSDSTAGNIGKQWDEIVGAFDKAKAGSIGHSIDNEMSDAAKAVDVLQEKLTKLLTDSFINGDIALKPPKPVKLKVQPVIEDPGPQHEAIRLGTYLDTSNFDKDIKVLQTRIDKHPMILSFTIPVKESQDAFAKAKEFADKINGILTKGIESGIESVSRSIGDAFAGGNLGGIGKAFLAELGGLIEDLGRGLIELGGIKTALAGLKLSGPAYIALGIAAEILGSTIVSKAGKSHAFAEGGIVTGPVNALIGEAGPEVIFPLNELNKFVKGSTGASNHNVNVTGRISGNDLQLVLARNTKNQRNV